LRIQKLLSITPYGRSFWQEAEYSIEKKKRRREEGRRKGKREKERTKL